MRYYDANGDQLQRLSSSLMGDFPGETPPVLDNHVVYSSLETPPVLDSADGDGDADDCRETPPVLDCVDGDVVADERGETPPVLDCACGDAGDESGMMVEVVEAWNDSCFENCCCHCWLWLVLMMEFGGWRCW